MSQLSSAQVVSRPDTYSTWLLHYRLMAVATKGREQTQEAHIGCPRSDSGCDDNDIFPAPRGYRRERRQPQEPAVHCTCGIIRALCGCLRTCGDLLGSEPYSFSNSDCIGKGGIIFRGADTAGYAIDKTDFIHMYQRARETALTSKNIQHAWAKSELFPLDSTIVLQKLSIVNEARSVTSSELAIMLLNDPFMTIFTSTNSDQVNNLLKIIDESCQKILNKIIKACKAEFANIFLLQIIN